MEIWLKSLAHGHPKKFNTCTWFLGHDVLNDGACMHVGVLLVGRRQRKPRKLL